MNWIYCLCVLPWPMESLTRLISGTKIGGEGSSSGQNSSESFLFKLRRKNLFQQQEECYPMFIA